MRKHNHRDAQFQNYSNNDCSEKSLKPQPYTKKYRQLIKAGRRRGTLPQGRTENMVVQFQNLRPENICTSNITYTAQVTFSNIYVYENSC